MKKVSFVVMMIALFAMTVSAAEWTGAISEAGCGLKHAEGGAGAEKCVSACVKKGQAPVFVSDGKVIKIANADKVMDFLGKKVKVTGTLKEDTVTIQSIAAAN